MQGRLQRQPVWISAFDTRRTRTFSRPSRSIKTRPDAHLNVPDISKIRGATVCESGSTKSALGAIRSFEMFPMATSLITNGRTEYRAFPELSSPGKQIPGILITHCIPKSPKVHIRLCRPIKRRQQPPNAFLSYPSLLAMSSGSSACQDIARPSLDPPKLSPPRPPLGGFYPST